MCSWFELKVKLGLASKNANFWQSEIVDKLANENLIDEGFDKMVKATKLDEIQAEFSPTSQYVQILILCLTMIIKFIIIADISNDC